ncbi:hypothetical protein DUI87_25567 [Hirundo rustica rustica]|uniref:Uncharacterized protein n=1 Tax=Hirundo rustica rustica TaxID=333673 RepID=A0A3M0JH92_HIRRU|nr:hypothetical protein DUI87_25567 [Hirundo rustica rustica]
MSFLLPALVLLAAGTAVLLAVRVLGSRAGGSRRGRAAPGAPGSPPAEEEEESPSRGPAAPGSGPYLPCGCGPGCGPCAAAARELRDLVTPLWPGPCFPRDPEVWQQWWRDLERLLERGRLPCCASSSSSGSPRHSQSLSESRQAPNAEDAGDRPRCSLGVRRYSSSLRMHVAKKNLEVRLRAQPVPVRRSRERLVQLEASPRSSESHAPDGEDAAERSACCSPGCAGASGTRSALSMHVARKSLEVKLGARPAAVRSSQEKAAELEASRSGRRPTRGSRSATDGNVPCSESEILQKQRELEFPHLRGAPPSPVWPLLAAQMLLRMLCLK